MVIKMDFMNNLPAQIILGLLFVGYTGYTTVQSILLFLRHQKAKQEIENMELMHDSYLWPIFSGCLAVVSFVTMFFVKEGYYFQLAYGCLSIIFLGLAFETLVRKRIWFGSEAFFYVDKTVRYRSILSYEMRNGLVRNIRILLASQEKLEVSKKMGRAIQKHQNEWKKEKKTRKKARA